jgi:hypothetical protein
MSRLTDSVKSRSVDRNLVIHFVGFLDDPVNVLVLAINLCTHGFAEGVENSSTAMDGVSIND